MTPNTLLGDKLKSLGITQLGRDKHEPLWKGPESNEKLGGITFSMLSRFLVCRERFRCWYLEGLRPIDGFNHRIEYGNMWHVCEETYAKQGLGSKGWEQILRGYCIELTKKYPLSKEQILKWFNVCLVQFNAYIVKWYQRETDEGYKVLEQEQVFCVSYILPSGRIVYLKGKRDKVLSDKDGYIWLQENKTKGDIDEQAIATQLTFDLQTMLYIIAMEEERSYLGDNSLKTRTSYREGTERIRMPLAGVIYNVIRRPLSGGRHTIVQHKPTKSNPQGESTEAYYKRLGGLITEDVDYFFMRWDCLITREDIENFKTRCLNPVLENLCHWYDLQLGKSNKPIPPWALHWQHPFGIFNQVDNGDTSDIDNYIATGDETGLKRGDKLFEELYG